MNPLYAAMPTTIFEEMSALAAAHDAINLGQGFPDGDGPPDVLRAAADALLTRSNQYPPSRGLPSLRAAVARHYRRHQGIDVDPAQVLVTSGATEALAAAFLALLAPGDEVILLEPMYDAYLPLVRRAGGVPRLVTLAPPDWRLPLADIAAAIGPRTRAIVLNDPLNPVGRVFDRAEVAALARLCVAHDLVAVCDAVWEHVVFDGRRHHPLIAEPGMAARTVKIGSAGKMFALTGWKVGFVVADPALLEPIARAHQFLAFSTPPNLQHAVAEALDKDEAWFGAARAGFERGRDRLSRGLRAAGIGVLRSEGTYFLCADLSGRGLEADGRALCRRLATEARVATIPLAPFYASGRQPEHLVRLCFAKADAVIDAAVDRLARWMETAAAG